MKHATAGEKQRHGRRWPFIGLAVVLLPPALFAAYRMALRAKVERRMEATRAAGYPATPEELDAWYGDPPDDENGAVLFDQALSRFEQTEDWEVHIPPIAAPLSQQDRKLSGTFLSKNKAALELLERGLKLPQWRFTTYREYRASYPGLDYTVAEMATLLGVKATLSAETEDPAAAGESLVLLVRLETVSEACPGWYTQGEWGGVDPGDTTVLNALIRVLSRTRLTESQLSRLQAALKATEDEPVLRSQLVGERCLLIAALRRRLAELREHEPISATAYVALGFQDMDLALVFDVTDEYLDAAPLPLPQRLAAAAEIGRGMLGAADDVRILTDPRSSVRRFLALTGLLFETDAERIAKLRAARSAVAVERYRLKNGNVPEKLEELVPSFLSQVPLDPFDGKPLRYKKTATGYKVYSIGSDGDDDGGADGSGPNVQAIGCGPLDSDESKDIVVEIGRQPRSGEDTSIWSEKL